MTQVLLLVASSVARVGGIRVPPIGLWSMQNRMFFVLLRPIFCEKWKIAPPHTKIALPQTSEFAKLDEKSVSITVKTFFFFFFFGDHLILGGKNLWISELSEKFRLNFRTNRLKLIQDQWKFESRSFAHFSLFQNSPPPPFPNPGYAPTCGANFMTCPAYLLEYLIFYGRAWARWSCRFSRFKLATFD